MRQTGVSRQRVYQILHQLIQEGKATRARAPGPGCRYLWFRSDADAAQGLRLYRHKLARGAAGILSCLQPDTVHSMPQIAAHLGMPYHRAVAQTSQLIRLGLVTTIRIVRPNLISIAPSGLEHSERDIAASKAPVLDVVRSLGQKRAAFIEILGVFGEARTRDVSAALLTEGQEARQLLSGQTIRALMSLGIAERVDGGSGKQMRYRLTDAGTEIAAWIATQRPSPTREDLESRISATNARCAAMLREKLRRRRSFAASASPAGAQSPAQARIVRALAEGPLHTNGLRSCISDLGHHPNSIYLMLNALAARGAIREVGFRRCGKLWTLPDGGP